MSSNKDPVERRALSVTEAARACGISRASVYRLVSDGKLKTIKIGARRLIRPEALEALLDGSASQ